MHWHYLLSDRSFSQRGNKSQCITNVFLLILWILNIIQPAWSIILNFADDSFVFCQIQVFQNFKILFCFEKAELMFLSRYSTEKKCMFACPLRIYTSNYHGISDWLTSSVPLIKGLYFESQCLKIIFLFLLFLLANKETIFSLKKKKKRKFIYCSATC